MQKGGDERLRKILICMNSNSFCYFQRYIKPRIEANSYMDFYRKTGRVFDNRQLFALKAIFEWRDKTARQEDESNPYVLPNHMMLTIAEALPREMQGVLACCNPIPPLVKQNLQLLHQYILKAREQPLIKVCEKKIQFHALRLQHFSIHHSHQWKNNKRIELHKTKMPVRCTVLMIYRFTRSFAMIYPHCWTVRRTTKDFWRNWMCRRNHRWVYSIHQRILM